MCIPKKHLSERFWPTIMPLVALDGFRPMLSVRPTATIWLDSIDVSMLLINMEKPLFIPSK